MVKKLSLGTVRRAGSENAMRHIGRAVPRPFTMHWGKGQIVEEASFLGRYHEPALQLMEFEDGSRCIRFCYYGHGRFQRSPLMMSEQELTHIHRALRRTPRLRRLLRRMLAG